MGAEGQCKHAFPGQRDRSHPLDPPPEYAQMRSEEPLAAATLWDGTETWLATRYDDVRAVLLDTRFSSDPANPGFPRHTPASQELETRFLSKLDPPEHTAIRRMLLPAFSPRSMAAIEDVIEQIVNDLLDGLAQAPRPVDLVETFALLVPTFAICEILGAPAADRQLFYECASISLAPASTQEAGRTINKQLNDYLDELITIKQRDPGDDLISHLLASQVASGALSRNDLIHQARNLVVAGFDTTGNTIALGVVLLLQHPEQLAELLADPSLWPRAVDEILRYTTITHHGRRRAATVDIKVGNHLVRAGEGIIACQDAANRDSSAFPNPDVFDIHRDAHNQVGFGYGQHRCLGAPLATLELNLALRLLFERFPTLSLAVPVEELAFKYEHQIYGLYSLPVTW